jgi:hypothetical protein|tara:strand:- start:56 stop:343 length:288 start_codon:yes stop_codon:yes gene_type:complete
MKKKFKYDGKSRPSNDLYKKNYKMIFGKKVKKDEEVTGYYYNGYDKNAEIEVLTEKVKDPFKTQQDELDESYKQSKKNKKEREKELKKLCDRNGF